MSTQKAEVTKDPTKKIVEILPYVATPKNAPKSIPTPLGSKFIIKQKYYFDEDGNKCCEPGEKLDLDAYIQSARVSCDIAAIVAKYQAGDESVLHVAGEGFYGDSLALPKDLYDVKRMNELYDQVNGAFDKLPDDLKALFNNDGSEFLNSILNNKANSIIDGYNKKKAEEAQENVNNG